MARQIKVGLILVFICSSILSFGFAAPPSDSQAVRQKRMVQFRQAGLHTDRTQITEMVKLLPEHDYSGYTVTILHALAQLGETSALPAIDKRMESEKDVTLSRYGVAERARLVAEADAKSLHGRDRASTQVRHFLVELGLSVDDINGAVTTYKTSVDAWKVSNPSEDSLGPPSPIELFAMRELADMVYHGAYADYAAQPQFAHINFSLDYASALKVRLAALTPQARIEMMVNDISHEVTGSTNDKYEMQLLLDEGKLARQAITAKQQEISLHPEMYRGQWGLIAGVSLLRDVSDQIGSPTMATAHLQINQADFSAQFQYAPGY